ncbi:MAG: TlpA disulfide reductase family protein [Devosia sp.]
MSEPQPERPKLSQRRVLSAVALSAVVAIAITYWVSNAGGLKAADCAPQALAAQRIDAAATGELAALNGTGTGRGYADLAFEDAHGKPMTLADLSGKVLLVNFWASWCIPCRAEMPALNALAASQNGHDFAVVTINTGDAQAGKAEAFFKDGAWSSLPFYIDRKFAVLDRLKVNAVSVGLPTTLLLDKKGCEVGVLQGPAEWNSPDGMRVIEALKAI